ncbi:MAG TPA: universal stress protein [Ktedonobacteraceae bacterium]|nr:universal stress protein [Ktedonobacteraceae bacterium]
MFQRILIPLDGSRRAEEAIPVAARIARSTGGTIVLARAVTSLIDATWYPAYLEDRREYGPVWYPVNPSGRQGQVINSDVDGAKEYLTTVALSPELAGIETILEVLPGDPAHTILLIARSQNVDLIVMCSRGETGLKRWLLGSVAQKVARHSPIPVFILREGAEKLSRVQPEGKRAVRILVPLDESLVAEAALLPAAQLSAALSTPMHGTLHLARILPLPAIEDIEDKGREEIAKAAKAYALKEATSYLHTIEHQLQKGDTFNGMPSNLEVTTSVVVDTDIAGRLMRMAESGEDKEGSFTVGPCDIIALATHGRGGVGRWLVGSTTERILESTQLPLLIIRPQKAQVKKDHTSVEAEQLSHRSE